MKYTQLVAGTLASLSLLCCGVSCTTHGNSDNSKASKHAAVYEFTSAEPDQQSEDTLTLPAEAVDAFLNTSWLANYYHLDLRDLQIHQGFVAAGASLAVGETPVEVVKTASEKTMIITAIEAVDLVNGYVIRFKYPVEGVFGTMLIIPDGKKWETITIGGGER